MDIEEMSKEISKKVCDFTQSAVGKGKELTETAKIMLSVRSNKEKIRAAQQRLGQYVAENRLFTEDATIHALYAEIDGYAAEIQNSENRMHILKNQAVCPGCGAILPLNQLFCDKCGTKMPEPAVQDSIMDFVENQEEELPVPEPTAVENILKNVSENAAAAKQDETPVQESACASEETAVSAEPKATEPKIEEPKAESFPEMKFPWE